MNQETDELLGEVVTECLEHVGQMENLLLTLESTADDPDPEVVNSIFRSAHSIKGVTGFCGLNKIKELAHVFENVLNAFRQGSLAPTSSSVDILLNSTDYLRELLENAAQSEEYDISAHLKNLSGILSDDVEDVQVELSPEEIETIEPVAKQPANTVEGFTDKTGRIHFLTEKRELEEKAGKGHHVYILRLDLLRDAPSQKRTPVELINHIGSLGEIHDTSFELDQVRIEGDEAPASEIPLAVLFSSLIDPDMIATALDVPDDDIEVVVLEEKEEIKKAEPEVAPVKQSKAVEPERKIATLQPKEVEEPMREQIIESPAAITEKVINNIEDSAAHDMTRTAAAGAQTQSFLRVNVALLDKLMNLAGELVLGRNQLVQTVSSSGMPALLPVAQRIDMITSELQAEIMQTRMQELAGVFGKFPRLVRDLSKSLNKKVDLRIEGQETELDKTIIEALGDPLVHIVRNSMDHGLETPEVRSAAGKSPVGVLHVKAYHEAGQVNIEIADDGAGINRDRLKEKAVKAGVITQAEAQSMSDQAALELIFKPGLSTAETVSDVSGRGVGMDVVRSNLEKIGGVLDLQSELGAGTTTRIKLPLTMAIIPCLIVRLGKNERYAVPQINLTELVRVRTAELNERIERIGGAEVLRLRGALLPLVRLGEVLEVEGFFRDPITNELKPDRRKNIADRRSSEAEEDKEDWSNQRSGLDRRQAADALNILVLSAGDLEYGLIVDELEDTEEIVVKPLGRHLKEIPSYAGATIMGDGRVAPILDIPGLAQQAELHRKKDQAEIAAREKQKSEEMTRSKDMEKVLVFNHGQIDQFAVPIPLVARIERVDTSRIEKSMGHESIQYRGGSLRLIKLDKHLPVESFPESDKVFIIVFEIGGKEIGVCASTLVDEKLVPFDLDTHTHQRPGVMGSMIIDDRTVMVIDIYELVELEEPDWQIKGKKASEEKSGPKRVLLVEDSEFFLNKVSSYLEDAGLEVLKAMNGAEGLEILTREKVDLVLTDIEMPIMNGYEMVKRIRSNPEYTGFPIVALSSLAGDEDVRKGFAAGVDRYLIKLDKTTLVDTVLEYLEKK